MNVRTFGNRLLVGLAAMLLAGCTAGSCPPATLPPSAAVVAATTPVPGTPSPVASPAGSAAAAEPWDLVWFSDSSVAIANPMAAQIEKALSVDVTVHDFWGPATRGSAVFIADLIDVQAVKDALVGAEMIVLYANPGGTDAGDKLAEACASGDPTPRDPPKVYTAADFAPFAERLQAIYDGILNMRLGRPVILRAVDLYVPVISGWRQARIEAACTASWEAWTGVAREVAAKYHVPMASMYDAFNGPKHDEDPVAKGYIGDDGVHPSDKGRAVQVDVIDALGYEPINP